MLLLLDKCCMDFF